MRKAGYRHCFAGWKTNAITRTCRKRFDRYEPKNGYEQSLLSVMKEGLECPYTLNTASWNTATIPSTRKNRTFCPCISARQIRVIYDLHRHDNGISQPTITTPTARRHMTSFRSPPVTCLRKRRNCSYGRLSGTFLQMGGKNSSTSQYKPI